MNQVDIDHYIQVVAVMSKALTEIRNHAESQCNIRCSHMEKYAWKHIPECPWIDFGATADDALKNAIPKPPTQ